MEWVAKVFKVEDSEILKLAIGRLRGQGKRCEIEALDDTEGDVTWGSLRDILLMRFSTSFSKEENFLKILAGRILETEEEFLEVIDLLNEKVRDKLVNGTNAKELLLRYSPVEMKSHIWLSKEKNWGRFYLEVRRSSWIIKKRDLKQNKENFAIVNKIKKIDKIGKRYCKNKYCELHGKVSH